MTDTDTAPPLAGADKPRLHRMFLLRWEPSQQSHVLLYPEGVVTLNPTAAQILERCTGERSVDDIVADLTAAFAAPAAQVRPAPAIPELAYAKGWIDLHLDARAGRCGCR